MEARRGFFKTKKANGATPEKKKVKWGQIHVATETRDGRCTEKREDKFFVLS